MYFSDIWHWLLLLSVLSYAFGNISFSIIISKKRTDIRKLGSGNPGTMNMLRNYGAGFGALTLTLDIFKGIIPALVGFLIFREIDIQGYNIGYFALYLAGISAVVGHIFPIALKFKGGKGVATTFGVFFVAEPLTMSGALVVCILFICIFEYGSVGSFIALCACAVVSCLKLNSTYFVDGQLTVPLDGFLTTCILIFALIFLVLFAHRKNIYQLCAGTEHKTKLRGIILKVFKKKSSSKKNV